MTNMEKQNLELIMMQTIGLTEKKIRIPIEKDDTQFATRADILTNILINQGYNKKEIEKCMNNLLKNGELVHYPIKNSLLIAVHPKAIEKYNITYRI